MTSESERYPDELIDSAEALTRLIAEDLRFEETMKRMTDLAVQAMDGAEFCSISQAAPDGSNFRTVATTDDIGNRIDDLQKETGEGPCLSSVEDHQTFHIRDMVEDETWPKFSRRAGEETGIKSMVSYVLRLSDDLTGAMNMMSSRKDAFSPLDVDAGTLFAAQAAVAMHGAIIQDASDRKVAQLEEGMKTRQMIGQATGILMAAHRVDEQAAFEMLKTASQHANVKLRDIAAKVVEKADEV